MQSLIANVLGIVAVLIAVFAFLWEFILLRTRRLGYRVQMDTTVTGQVAAQLNPEWTRLLGKMNNPSLVLLRFENTGVADIDSNHYIADPGVKAGIRVRFPGRRVVAMAVTELSDGLGPLNFTTDSGLDKREVEDRNTGQIHGEIDVPKVPLNRHGHYKVMALLERTSLNGTADASLEISGGIKGGRFGGGVEQTESRTGTPRWAKGLIYVLAILLVVQPVIFLRWFSGSAPLDCATGNVTIVGSTAFRPVLEEAVRSYDGKCPDAHFSFASEGSQAGLGTLDRIGRTKPAKAADYVAFSDGPKEPGAYPRLIQRPIGFALFTLVANPNAGIDDLPRNEIRDLFVSGKYSNWKQLNGFNVPISIVDRSAGSGTRNTFQTHVLDGRVEQNYNSDDCQNRKPGTANRTVRCQLDSTDDVLDTVARTDGAIGYAELGAATARRDVRLVRIDGQEASLAGSEHGAYPFGETEYAYTYRQPGPDSLSASFLRFLTNKIGQDVIRNGGDRPCADLDNPVLCHPDGE